MDSKIKIKQFINSYNEKNGTTIKLSAEVIARLPYLFIQMKSEDDKINLLNDLIIFTRYKDKVIIKMDHYIMVLKSNEKYLHRIQK